jgi:predicted membrane protein
LYLVALALLLIGTFGLFGQERDPLAAVFLVPLGLPWILGVDVLPEALKLWAAIFAPLLNIAILTVLTHVRESRRDS